LFQQLRVNLTGDRRNEVCYDVYSAAADSPDLAAHIRDNPADVPFDTPGWYVGDAILSSLLLDDLSPAYRADLFARMSAPIIGGNVTPEELEVSNRANFGQTFETAYLGRKTECLPCHRSEYAVTDSPDPDIDRHWPLPGHFELAVYGPDAADADEPRAHAVFRHNGFSYGGAPDRAWGMNMLCGELDFAAVPGTDLLDEDAYMIGGYPGPDDATVFELDRRLQAGFAALSQNGLVLEPDQSVADPNVAGAYLVAMNIANRTWKEAMGWPLVVANNFPRNAKQNEILRQLTDTVVSERYSLSELLAEIATHDYYNQAPPDSCSASSAYHLAAVFNPFTKTSLDPNTRLNGVGDAIHRYSAFVLIDMAMRTMWWDRPERFGPDEGQIPNVNCGAGMYPPCDEAPINLDFLRDTGVFLNDSESGFNGVDFNGLLHWEEELAQGTDPALGGDCTGPLGGPCAASDWIDQLVGIASATPDALVFDVVVAVKDRVLAEPTIYNAGEIAAIEALVGLSLDQTVAAAGAGAVEQAARLYAGLLFNTPQFMLDGVAGRDQDPANDPVLVVPGTSTSELCETLGALVLQGEHPFVCSDAGIEITG
jgi:hypothetical protein